jgi:predicted metal-dependent enzyme (double-stranded beta helix superfamily)
MNAGGPTLEMEPRRPVPEGLRRFIWDIQSMVELAESEREILLVGRDLMARLIAGNDWMPGPFAAVAPDAACQYQIYRDNLERFCVLSTIIDAGAALAISRPGLWEIMGVFRGAVHRGQSGASGAGASLRPGSVETFGSGGPDSFSLSNPAAGSVAIVIHVYGGDTAKLAMDYANGRDAPAYDIFAIQADIGD